MDRQEMQTIIVFYSIGGKEMAKVDANILPIYYQSYPQAKKCT